MYVVSRRERVNHSRKENGTHKKWLDHGNIITCADVFNYKQRNTSGQI